MTRRYRFNNGWIFESGQDARIAGQPVTDNPFPWWYFSDRRDWRNGWRMQDDRRK